MFATLKNLPAPELTDLVSVKFNQLAVDDALKKLKATNWIVAGSGITIVDNGNGTITISQGAGAVSGSGATGRVAYWSGTSALTSSGNFLFTDSSGSGSALEFELKNTTLNAGNVTRVRLTSGGPTGGDLIYQFSGAGSTWLAGVDVSDNRFTIALGTTTLGTALSSSTGDVFRLGYIGGSGYPYCELRAHTNLYGTLTSNGQADFAGSVNSGGQSLFAAGISGGNYTFTLRNNQNDGTAAGALLSIEITGGTGDPFIRFVIPGGNTWAFGPDNSDSDALVASVSTALGTNNRFRIATNGDTSFTSATDASAVGTAAFVLAGGLGVAKKFYLGDDLYLATGKAYRVNGVQVLTNQQAGVGATPAANTAGASYTATEQTMLQEAHDGLRLMMGALKTHGMIAT